MKRIGISHATLMLLMCTLPLLIFFAVALAGVHLNPLWVPVVMILCCLAMFYLTAGACGHDRAERVPAIVPKEPALPPAEAMKTDDVFRVHLNWRVGEAVVQEGELLKDPDETYAVLKERSKNTGLTPLLQEDREGRPLLVWLLGASDQGAGKERGPWLNVLLLHNQLTLA